MQSTRMWSVVFEQESVVLQRFVESQLEMATCVNFTGNKSLGLIGGVSMVGESAESAPVRFSDGPGRLVRQKPGPTLKRLL